MATTRPLIEIRVGESFELPLVPIDQKWGYHLPSTDIFVVDDNPSPIDPTMRSIKVRAVEEGLYLVSLLLVDEDSPNIIKETREYHLKAGHLSIAKHLHFPGSDDDDDDYNHDDVANLWGDTYGDDLQGFNDNRYKTSYLVTGYFKRLFCCWRW